jgi:hypothetical protein
MTASVNAALGDLFKECVVIAVIDAYVNENRPRRVKLLFEYRRDLISCLNHESFCSEGLGIFDWIDSAELHPRYALTNI